MLGNRKGRNSFGDVQMDDRILLKWILNKYPVKGIHLDQDGVQCWAVVNTAVNLRI
jgi:hypothetical protein